MPILTVEMWQGTMYFGSPTGIVYTIQGDTDNQPRTGAGTGTSISSAYLSSFQDYEEAGLYHTGMFARPVFLSAANPIYSIAIRYDYNISEVFTPGSASPPSGALWDIGIWDVDTWGGAVFEVESLSGAQGIGRAMAIALSMTTSAETTLIRTDIMFDTGGMT